MNYVLIIHEVADYNAWKDIFDSAAAIRKVAGEIEFKVLKYQTDKNKIVHFPSWSSLEGARPFFESDEVKNIRVAAGVKSPEFIYLQKLDSGLL